MSVCFFWIFLVLVEKSLAFLFMLTLLSFFLWCLFLSQFAGWKMKMRRSWYSLESSFDIAIPHPTPKQTLSLCLGALCHCSVCCYGCCWVWPFVSLTGREAEDQQQQLFYFIFYKWLKILHKRFWGKCFRFFKSYLWTLQQSSIKFHDSNNSKCY